MDYFKIIKSLLKRFEAKKIKQNNQTLKQQTL